VLALELSDHTVERQPEVASTTDTVLKSPAITVPATSQSPNKSLTAVEADRETRLATAQLITPPPPPTRHEFVLLQQWEGVVSSEASNDEFNVVLRDLTHPARPEEQATFSIEQVPVPDRRLVLPGAVFYWSIGYEDLPTGTRRTVSTLRFRRLPVWTRTDMQRIRRDVDRFRRLFANPG
jgi:hypothetical protein